MMRKRRRSGVPIAIAVSLLALIVGAQHAAAGKRTSRPYYASDWTVGGGIGSIHNDGSSQALATYLAAARRGHPDFVSAGATEDVSLVAGVDQHCSTTQPPIIDIFEAVGAHSSIRVWKSGEQCNFAEVAQSSRNTPAINRPLVIDRDDIDLDPFPFMPSWGF